MIIDTFKLKKSNSEIIYYFSIKQKRLVTFFSVNSPLKLIQSH